MTDKKASSKKINLVIVASAVLLILIVVLVTQFNKKDTDEYVNQQLSLPLNSLDYNIQNPLQSTVLGATDEYLFYSNNRGLFRINKDGSNKIELDSGEISNINVYKDNLYYTKLEGTDISSDNSNKPYQILKHSIKDGSNSLITTLGCHRIESMLVANDLIICKPVIFEATGGLNDNGEPVGNLKSEYKAFSLDGQKSSFIEEDRFNTFSTVNYIFSQTELDSSLAQEYPDVSLKNKYVIEDKQYFVIRTIRGPQYTSVLYANAQDRKPVLISKHTPSTPEGTPSNISILGLTYSNENLYYILRETSKDSNNNLKNKMDLYMVDTKTNTSALVGNLLND